MTKEEIEELVNKYVKDFDNKTTYSFSNGTVNEIKKQHWIAGYKKALEERPSWIDVNDQTPTICGDGVLTKHRAGGINITYFSKSHEGKEAEYFLNVGYTHWMELPAFPNPKENA